MPAKEERKFREFVDREKDLIIKLMTLENLKVFEVLAEKLDNPEKLEKFTNTLRIMSILFQDQAETAEDQRSHVAE